MATTMHVSDVAELLSEGRTHFNLSPALLVEHSIRRNEAKLAANGALVGYTNRTGRSPKDKFIVKDETTAQTVNWGAVNQPFEPEKFDALYERVIEHLRGREPNLDLPTDVQATAFQRRVWEELRRIPYGTTRTYSQVARAIGQPAAVRAVARACATNPVSLVVPCHRVVRGDGKLAGYRWGVERKQALLEHESAGARAKQTKTARA